MKQISILKTSTLRFYAAKQRWKLLIHAIVGLFFFAFPFILFPHATSEVNRNAFFSPYYWLFVFSLLFLTYFNFYYLFTNFYLKQRYFKYAASLFGLFISYLALRPTDLLLRYYFAAMGRKVPPIQWLELDLFTCIFFIIVVSTGTAVQLIRKYRAVERRALLAEAEKANAELAFLKAQVNPHFLYNTLNNIYSLSQDQHPETSDSILKLSNIMRYITNEASQDCVLLEDELTIIKDYIDLQKLRLTKNITVEFEVIGEPEVKQIAPLILITYIENAFKYGVSTHQKATISIIIEISGNKVFFFCRNRDFSALHKTESSGIGLQNTCQRLERLYPFKYHLLTNASDGYYSVNLTLITKVRTTHKPQQPAFILKELKNHNAEMSPNFNPLNDLAWEPETV